jgi:hypothetical protein
MRPDNELKLQKIKRISSILRVICKVFLAIYVVRFLLILWALVAFRAVAGGDHNFIWGGYNDVTYNFYDLTIRDRVIVAVMGALTWGIMFKCVYHLHRLLGDYSHGEIFAKESAVQIRHLGISCVLWGGVKFVWLLAAYAISVAHQAPGQGDLGLDLAVIGLIIVAISWFMDMAGEIREENELTV